MSSLFCIGDDELDLQDEDFLLEACKIPSVSTQEETKKARDPELNTSSYKNSKPISNSTKTVCQGQRSQDATSIVLSTLSNDTSNRNKHSVLRNPLESLVNNSNSSTTSQGGENTPLINQRTFLASNNRQIDYRNRTNNTFVSTSISQTNGASVNYEVHKSLNETRLSPQDDSALPPTKIQVIDEQFASFHSRYSNVDPSSRTVLSTPNSKFQHKAEATQSRVSPLETLSQTPRSKTPLRGYRFRPSQNITSPLKNNNTFTPVQNRNDADKNNLKKSATRSPSPDYLSNNKAMSNSATSCTSTSFTRTLSTSGGSLSRTPSRSLSCSFKTPSTSTCSLSRTLSSTSASGSSKTPSTSTVSLSRTPCASLTSLSKSPVRKDSPVMPMSSNSKARKFPGPAGMLPKLTPGQHLDNVASPKPGKRKTPSPTQKTRSLASIGQEDDFKSDAWLAMMKEMQTAGIPLMMQFTVTELLRKAALQQLNHGKVPYMCTLIKSFSVMGNDASVILKDPTGEIHGTVHRKVLECHLGDLGPGAGVLLKQVSVFSPSPRRHYINITPGNILKIYPPDPEQLASSQPLNTQCPQQVYDSSESDYVDLMDDDEDAFLEEMKDEAMTTQSDDTPNQQFEDLLGVLDDDDDIFNDEALLL